MGIYLDLRGWVDLGLPSGKLWCFDNEDGYFTFDEAVEKFQDQLPTIEDWQELIDNTTQRFDKKRKGVVFTAKNCKELFLCCTGNSLANNIYAKSHYMGCYWSSTFVNMAYARYLFLYKQRCILDSNNGRYNKLSVRLIKAK